MKLCLNEKIKKLRLDKNWTQEEFASMLGVQSQSVSRWETNSTMPDIELLPDIAILFDISVDELLGVNTFINGKKIECCLDEAENYYHTGEIPKMVEVLENGIKNYPTNVKLKLKLVEALFSFYEGDRKSICDRIIVLGKELIDKLSNINDLCLLYQILAYVNLELGNQEQAKMYALKLPSISHSSGFVLSNIETGDEKDRVIQANIFSLLNNIVIEIFKLNNSNNYSSLDKIKFFDKVNQLIRIIYENEDYGYEYCLLKQANMNIFKEYMKLKDEKNAYSYLEESLKYAKKFDAIDKVIKHDSLLNNRLEFDKKIDFGKDYDLSEVDMIEMELQQLDCYNDKKIKDLLENFRNNF